MELLWRLWLTVFVDFVIATVSAALIAVVLWIFGFVERALFPK